MLAESPNVTEKAKCISVQLPSGSVRNALNIKNNPQLFGAEIMLFGDVLKYNSMPGIKNTSKYKILSSNAGAPAK